MKTWKKTILWIVGILLFLLLVGPFLVPIPPLDNGQSPQDLAGPESQFLDLRGVKVHFIEKGEREPVFLLLHGFGASTYSWREVFDPLAEEGRVVAFDRPGFGLTERVLTWEGENPYAPQTQVGLVLDLLDVLGVEEAILIGNSAGGTIATSFALQHPGRVSGLVLVDAAIYTGGGSPTWIHPLLRMPQMDRLGPLLARTIATRGEAFLESAYHDPALVTEEVRAGYKRPLQVEGWDRALWELTKASRPLDLDQEVDQIAVSTLVITGDDDRIVPPADSLRLAEEIPGASLVVIEDCGHLPQEECPGDFLDAVREFVQNLP